MKWLIDTDILIDFLRGSDQAEKYLKHISSDPLASISVITVAELYVGVREGKERIILDHFIQEFKILEINERIAQQGGIYLRDFGKTHGIGLADALIAATAFDYDLKLVTLNKKHYPMLKSIHIPYQKKDISFI